DAPPIFRRRRGASPCDQGCGSSGDRASCAGSPLGTDRSVFGFRRGHVVVVSQTVPPAHPHRSGQGLIRRRLVGASSASTGRLTSLGGVPSGSPWAGFCPVDCSRLPDGNDSVTFDL